MTAFPCCPIEVVCCFFHAIYNSKAYMVYLISKMNPFKSKYFFWVDIGAFRDDAQKWKPTGIWKPWPDLQTVKETFIGTKKERLLVGLVHQFNETSIPRFSDERVLVEGGFFGGGQLIFSPAEHN